MTDWSNRKLEIFIGSTRRDLEKARKKIMEAVWEAGHIPSGMELWTAGSAPVLDDIKKYLKRCDVHSILLGARYGEFINSETRSFVEWEYELSQKNKRPILVFMLDDASLEKEREKECENDLGEKSKEDYLKRFRKRLASERFCKTFKNDEAGIGELGRMVVTSINMLINSSELGDFAGWLKAESEYGRILHAIRENRFLQRVMNRLREFSVVGERVVLDEVAKHNVSENFWEIMQGRIQRHGYWNLFFESGSTIAYLSEQFEHRVLNRGGQANRWKVRTNNILTLLQLMLYTDVDVRPLPMVAPDPNNIYGAIFPREWGMLHEPCPKLPIPLHKREKRAVEKQIKELRGIGSKTLFLTTVSSIDIDHEQIHFRGPHIGSHPNLLFKRAIFTCGQPVVLFLNATKIGDPFKVGKRYPVFGPDLPWEQVVIDYPIAFCVGYDTELRSRVGHEIEKEARAKRNDPEYLMEVLNNLNMTITYEERKFDNNGMIFVANEKFHKLLPDD